MISPRIAVLASGGGSTTERFLNDIKNGKSNCRVVCVISNNQNAGVLAKTKEFNRENHEQIKIYHVGSSNFPLMPAENPKKGRQTKAEENEILRLLRKHEIDVVLLFGYLKKVGASIVGQYGTRKNPASPFETKMLNTHPGLLPLTSGLYGLKVQQKVLELESNQAGHCIFAVNGDYDAGPVITQHRIKKVPGETATQLFARVQKSEKDNLAADINFFLSNKYGGKDE